MINKQPEPKINPDGSYYLKEIDLNYEPCGEETHSDDFITSWKNRGEE
jgi:hypothetical protein